MKDNLIFGFDEWMLDMIHYHEMNMEQAMQLAHLCYDEDEYDPWNDTIFDTLEEYELDEGQVY